MIISHVVVFFPSVDLSHSNQQRITADESEQIPVRFVQFAISADGTQIIVISLYFNTSNFLKKKEKIKIPRGILSRQKNEMKRGQSLLAQ